MRFLLLGIRRAEKMPLTSLGVAPEIPRAFTIAATKSVLLPLKTGAVSVPEACAIPDVTGCRFVCGKLSLRWSYLSLCAVTSLRCIRLLGPSRMD